ncbi:hypothetical protein HY041_04565, partial [Candidatus Roizmanbacteria bacterium]|nr:hypothetical protein [Candidatus Roizmanbacteria bacterium]
MCVTCSSIKFDELVKTVCKVSQSEAGGKLDSFVKKLLLDAADESNRHELFAVLRENNPEKMSLFITKYVKDFPKKFHQFVFREI